MTRKVFFNALDFLIIETEMKERRHEMAHLARTLRPARIRADVLVKAAQDEYVLDKLVADESAPQVIFGFHAQQAVEKLLKAALSHHGLEYQRTNPDDFSVLTSTGAGITLNPDKVLSVGNGISRQYPSNRCLADGHGQGHVSGE